MKRFMLLCCGCGRLLNRDGSLTPSVFVNSRLDYTVLSDQDVALIFTFDDDEEGESFARQHGWQTIDGNHRCAGCSPAKQDERHGAILETISLTRFQSNG